MAAVRGPAVLPGGLLKLFPSWRKPAPCSDEIAYHEIAEFLNMRPRLNRIKPSHPLAERVVYFGLAVSFACSVHEPLPWIIRRNRT